MKKSLSLLLALACAAFAVGAHATSSDPRAPAVPSTYSSSSAAASANAAAVSKTKVKVRTDQRQSQAQMQAQSQRQALKNEGNKTNIEQRYQAAASSAIAPSMTNTSPCVIAKGGALNVVAGGVSIGGGEVREGCEVQEESKTMAQIGDTHGAYYHLCHIERVRKTREASERPCAKSFYPVDPYRGTVVGTVDETGRIVQ